MITLLQLEPQTLPPFFLQETILNVQPKTLYFCVKSETYGAFKLDLGIILG